MESFTIQCTSCESRIRVRNPNMIGQIANCPKCGSMILIAAPQKITVESGNPTDSVAVTREALPKPDESLLKNPSVFETGFRMEGMPPGHPHNVDLAHSEGDASAEPVDDEYRLAADPAGLDAARDYLTGASESSGDALPLGAWLPEAAAADPLPPPRASDIDASIQAVRARRQESAARSRHVMLVATIGLCSVLIAIGIAFAFFRWIAKPNVVAKNNPPAGKQPANVGPKNTDVGPAAPDNSPPPTLPEAEPGSQPLTDATAAVPPVAPAVDATPAEAMSDKPVPPASASQNSGPTTVGNATSTKTPLGGSIAPNLDAVLAPRSEDQPKGDVPLELPPGLQGFSRLFNQGFEPALSDASVPLDKAAELPADAANAGANKNGAPAPAAVDLVPATVDKKLTAQLSGVLIEQRRLSEALTTLSLIGDVPIVADLDALSVVGASKNTLVKFKATSAVSFESVLDSIAASAKIRFVPWEKRVIYARVSDEDLESRLPKVLPVTDLVSDAAQRDQLLQVLKQLVPEFGETLQMSDEGLQLPLTQDNRLMWYQLARLLETWRVARGISNEVTSAVVPKGSLLPAWPVEAMQQAAKTPIKQVVPSEPIARTWQRLTADARLACWVDWYGLQMADVNPRQKATVITFGRPLSDLLQHYANKYQVVFAMDDASSLWVTSPDMHRMQPRLFVLPLAEKTIDEWTAELEPLAPVHPSTGANMLKLIPTPDGQYLFVCCCRPILVEPNDGL